MGLKKCNSCLVEKLFNDFGSLKSSIDGHRPTCKECRKRESKKYYDNNKEKMTLATKKWAEKNSQKIKNIASKSAKKQRDQNPEKFREKLKSYREDNRDKYNGWARKYQSKRRSKDPIYNMKITIRNRVKRFHSSNKKTEEILGCSYEFFKSHIENKFVDGMTWDNHGDWHYDHIKPISLGKTEEEILTLNHYTNLQPLWAKDNLKKSNKIE